VIRTHFIRQTIRKTRGGELRFRTCAFYSMQGFNAVKSMDCNILISLRIRLAGNNDAHRPLHRLRTPTRRDEGLVGLQGFEPRTKGL